MRKAERLPAPVWRTKPSKRSVAAVRDRVGPHAADALSRDKVTWRTVADVLAATRRKPLPATNEDVQRHVEKSRAVAYCIA